MSRREDLRPHVSMRRMVKEHLLTFDATPLFPERIAYTVAYTLPDLEAQLYKDVTTYVRDEFNRTEALQHDTRPGTLLEGERCV